MSCKFVSIAIDGPAAAGKSTVAKLIAKELGYVYVDTGAMYRALAYFVLSKNIDPNNEKLVCKELKTFKVHFDEQGKIYVGNEDVSGKIRTMEVSKAVTPVSTFKEVREDFASRQRNMSLSQNVVMDGRDIGTAVLPDATLKIFMIASPEKRAERRFLENKEKGIKSTYEEVVEDLKRRDYIDSHREFAPLKKASDAIEVDTSFLSIRETADKIIKLLKQRNK